MSEGNEVVEEKRVSEDDPVSDKNSGEENHPKWSWTHFFRSKGFVTVMIATAGWAVWFSGVFPVKSVVGDIIICGGWVGMLVFFIFSRAWDSFFSNIKITAELKAAAQANVNADAAKIIETLKTVSNELKKNENDNA
jgi:hypothetical protein